jgi:hypothetical protein
VLALLATRRLAKGLPRDGALCIEHRIGVVADGERRSGGALERIEVPPRELATRFLRPLGVGVLRQRFPLPQLDGPSEATERGSGPPGAEVVTATDGEFDERSTSTQQSVARVNV